MRSRCSTFSPTAGGAVMFSTVLRYRGQYGADESTAKLLPKLGARPVTQEELDARAAAPPR